MEGHGDAPPNVRDLVEPTYEGRLRNVIEDGWLLFAPIPEEQYLREWQLRDEANALAQVLESPEVADRFLTFLFNDDAEARIIWLTETHNIMCEGPNDAFEEGSYSWFRDKMHMPHGQVHMILIRNSKRYLVGLQNFVTFDDEAPEVVTALLQMAARDPAISVTYVHVKNISAPVAGIEYLLSMARSPRRVEYEDRSSSDRMLPLQMQDAMAFRCNHNINLVVDLRCWQAEKIAALADSMRTNRCPRRIVLHNLDETSAAVIAPALQTTTCIERLEIEISLGSYVPGFKIIMEAVGRNRSICTLAVVQPYRGAQPDPKDIVWKWALRSPSIRTIDVSDVDRFRTVTDSERENNACSIANNLGNNVVITSIYYTGAAFDARIIRSRVAPRLKYNRFRPIVMSHHDCGGVAVAASERNILVSKLLGSHDVRTRPEFLFLLLKANRELLSQMSSAATSRRSAKRSRVQETYVAA